MRLPQTDAPASPLLVAEPARGLCKVLCFHPDHSLTLARMTRDGDSAGGGCVDARV